MSISDKTILVEKIKKWLDSETKIASLQKELKEIRKNKKQLSIDLSEIMKNRQLECIDVSQGQILYTKNQTKKGINKKYLSEILTKYYKGHEQAKELCEFILDNRECCTKETIRLKSNKK